MLTMHLINKFDAFDNEYGSSKTPSRSRKAVLVFLPGLHEISEMKRMLQQQWALL